MNWDVHITHVANKVSKCIGVMYKLKNILPESALFLLYNSFMLPYFSYCVTVWGNYNQTQLDVLYKLQKKALRICTGSHRLSHSAPLFYKMKTLTIFDMYTCNIAILGFYYLKDLLPRNISDMFCINSSIHNYNTRHCNYFHMWVVKTSYT